MNGNGEIEKFKKAIASVSADADEAAVAEGSGYIPFRTAKGSLTILDTPAEWDKHTVMIGVERPDRDASVVVEAAWAYGAEGVTFTKPNGCPARHFGLDTAWMGSDAAVAEVGFPENMA